MVNVKKKVLIVGGGLGGLAAAIRLRVAGCAVELWEKNPSLGGKLQERREGGFRWDTGPSLVTMPHLLEELFATAGVSLDSYLKLTRLPNACRYFWPDRTVIDEDEPFWHRPDVARFLTYARGIYELSGEAYLHHPPEEFWRAFTLASLPKLRHLPKVATFESLASRVNHYFEDPHLRQLFYRFATYNGSSPYLTPATFNIIPYVEQHFGAWYPQGGLARIAEAMIKLAGELGVILTPGVTAVDYHQGEVLASDGRKSRPDFLICNQDVLAAAQTWLAGTYSLRQRQKLLAAPLSCSGFVLFLGVTRQYPQLSHHNIFFTQDYPEEFTDIFSRARLPRDPTIYIAVTSRSDPDHAPVGQDNFFVLVNSPALPPGTLSPEEVERYSQTIIERLEQQGLEGLSQNITIRHAFTCQDFATRDLSHHGSLYGWASHSVKSALFRPPISHPNLKNLYFVGGTTHPGGGIPLVLLSGKMVAEKILRTAK
jgi:phytoene desaturase